MEAIGLGGAIERRVARREHPLSTRLREISNEIPNIGYGGCGHFALELSSKLPGSEIWVISTDHKLDVSDPNWNGRTHGPVAHAVCKHNGFYLDDRGSHVRIQDTNHEIPDGHCFVIKKVRPEVMESWLKHRNLWNSMFDRRKLPKMRRLVRERIGTAAMAA